MCIRFFASDYSSKLKVLNFSNSTLWNFTFQLWLESGHFSIMKKLWDLKNDLSYLELEGQGQGIIMEVTHPLLLGPFYLVKWPVNPNILAASVFIKSTPRLKIDKKNRQDVWFGFIFKNKTRLKTLSAWKTLQTLTFEDCLTYAEQ